MRRQVTSPFSGRVGVPVLPRSPPPRSPRRVGVPFLASLSRSEEWVSPFSLGVGVFWPAFTIMPVSVRENSKSQQSAGSNENLRGQVLIVVGNSTQACGSNGRW